MAAYLARTCAATIAALTIVGGGAGTAVADTWWADEIWQNLLRPCVDYSPQFPDRGPCYRNGFSDSGTLGHYGVRYYGLEEVDPGAETVFTAVVGAQEVAFDVADPEVNVDVASVTHHPPKGFEFIGVRVSGYTPTPAPTFPVGELDSTIEVDVATGDVTATAPAGGWALLPGRNGDGFASGAVRVDFIYRAPDYAPGSASGVTFTGTGVPASDGWVATGVTRVMPGFLGTGSTGS